MAKSESGTIRYTEYRLTAKDRLKYGIIGLGLAAMIARTIYKSLPVFLILGPVTAFLLPVFMKPKLKKARLERLTVQFREAIGILNGYISAGSSVENAFGTSAGQLEKLYGKNAEITAEFRRISVFVQLNRPVGEVLQDFADRSGLQDIRNFAEVFIIAGKTGGNLRDIIDRTATVLREKMAVGEEIINMTASRRYEQKVMDVIPFFIILYLDLTSPGFLDIMYTTLIGRLVMTGCLAMIAVAYFLSAKLLDIRV